MEAKDGYEWMSTVWIQYGLANVSKVPLQVSVLVAPLDQWHMRVHHSAWISCHPTAQEVQKDKAP